MADSEDFAKWAAQFLQQYESVSELGKQDSPSCAGQKYPGVTIEASRLLESVDAGGVPAFVTQRC